MCDHFEIEKPRTAVEDISVKVQIYLLFNTHVCMQLLHEWHCLYTHLLCTSGGLKVVTTRWHEPKYPCLSSLSQTLMFRDFMHNDDKQTEKLCFSLKLSAIGVIVVIICISNQQSSPYNPKYLLV